MLLSFALIINVNGQDAAKVWKSSSEPFSEMENIRSQIKAPEFPDKVFNVTDYGAVGDGKTLNTKAFKKAIDACHENGGGMVLVPFGIFLTGAIELKSNVNLHMADNAIISFSVDTKDYPIVFTRWEGM